MPDYRFTLSAREWLDAANWEVNDHDQHALLAEAIGKDKADEYVAMVDRMATNLLYTLDTIRMSNDSMAKLNLAIASIALDNVVPRDRGIE